MFVRNRLRMSLKNISSSKIPFKKLLYQLLLHSCLFDEPYFTKYDEPDCPLIASYFIMLIHFCCMQYADAFKLEMQRLIAACRLTRAFIQNVCHKMIEHCATVTDVRYFYYLFPFIFHSLCCLSCTIIDSIQPVSQNI